jgi:hypothetical protein
MSGDPSLLSTAIVVWTGRGQLSWPQPDDTRVVDRFGTDVAATLLPQIRELKDEFYASEASLVVADLKEMGDVAAAQFRKKHPELSEDAIQALAWCYTFANK